MPVTAQMLRNVMAEARPIIERQMNDAKIIAGFRDLIASNGGDWSALKALIKAHVEDEADDDGEGKRVRKILDKADSSTAYADMLGLAKMNEENFSAVPSYSQSGLTYAKEKGRGDAGSSSGRTADFGSANAGSNPAPVASAETGELTDTQESDQPDEAVAPATAAVASDEMAAQDDVGATASSTNSASPAAIPLGAANSAGEAPSSSPASPARHSDDDIPAFIKQDKPGCLKLKDGHCRISFATSALCAECNQHRAISRASA